MLWYSLEVPPSGTFNDCSETFVRKVPLRLLVVDVERWLSYKGTCRVILLVK